MSIHRLSIKATVAAAIGAIVLAGSAAAQADRAGGDAVTPRVLTFASVSLSPLDAVTAWAEAVEKASANTLAIEFHHGWREGEPDFETGTIGDVARGGADLAFVGARAFDTVGIDSFQALIAPMLIDSHELQRAVFHAGIPQEMLAGLEDLGIVGIVALPGPMIKILGKTRPYVIPSDYSGEVIGLQASTLHSATFEALGATSSVLHSDADISSVDGSAKQLGAIWGSHLEFDADYVTANVNLWPRPLIVFANAEVFASLDDQQRAAITSAGPVAVEAALEASRVEDANGGSALCEAGMRFPVATDDELAELRTALEPVYEQLAAAPDTSVFVNAIRAIKADVGAPPHTVDCDPSLPPAGPEPAVSVIDGVYTTMLTYEDYAASSCDGVDEKVPGDVTVFRLTLQAGDVEVLESQNGGELEPGFIGYYRAFRDRIEIGDGPTPFTARWVFDGKSLVLSELHDPMGDCVHAFVWTTRPWVLVDETQPWDLASPPEGKYVQTVTGADLMAQGSACGPQDPNIDPDWEGYGELWLIDGRAEMWQPNDAGDLRPGFLGTYSVFRDRLQIDETGGASFSLHWDFDGSELVLSDLEFIRIDSDDGCGHVDAWTAFPWVRID